MKKSSYLFLFMLLLFTTLVFASSLFAVYQVGDVVDDFSWTDNTGAPHSIYELINAEKAVVFFWGHSGCGGCVAAAAQLEAMWQTYNPGGHVYFLSENDWSIPPYNCTFYHSYDISSLYWDYGNGYVPFFAVIGGEYQLYYGDNPVSGVPAALDDAIASLGLMAGFDASIQTGPPSLGVQFHSTSGIADTWAWDLDGDGQIDSNEENPFFLYTDVGSYDVSLTVWSGADSASITQEDYITVTNSNNISGTVAGVWNTAFSPYTITDDVSIPDGCELTIEPDVQIITNNNSKIKVEGKIVADASGKAPIIFTSNDSWKGIQFFNTMEDNLIQNCEITNATYCAVDIENSKVDIIENTIYENSTTTQKGAAINVIGLESVYIYKNLIANNTSSILCAGIVCDNANPLISHNIIVNNTASFAGAISLKNSSTPTMINNTIANNESTSGFGAVWLASSSATVNNCILIDDLDVFTLFGSTVNVTYTCISGGYSGTGNINEDPMFENPTAGSGTSYNGLEASWSLLEGSPCIDAGDPASPPDPDGTVADMGALYFDHIAVDPNCTNLGISFKSYPNPFSTSTTISFSTADLPCEIQSSACGISQGEHRLAQIKIYNIKGQLVRILTPMTNDQCQMTNVVWNGVDDNGIPVSNGVYFYQLESENYKSEIRKMLLLR